MRSAYTFISLCRCADVCAILGCRLRICIFLAAFSCMRKKQISFSCFSLMHVYVHVFGVHISLSLEFTTKCMRPRMPFCATIRKSSHVDDMWVMLAALRIHCPAYCEDVRHAWCMREKLYYVAGHAVGFQHTQKYRTHTRIGIDRIHCRHIPMAMIYVCISWMDINTYCANRIKSQHTHNCVMQKYASKHLRRFQCQ